MINRMSIFCVVLIPLLFLYACTPTGFTKVGNDDLRHNYSDIVFPKKIGNFERVSIRTYDGAGRNVGVGYNIRKPECIISFTFFVYPRNKKLEDEFEILKEGIEYYNRDAVLISEGKCYFDRGGEPVEGLCAEHSFTQRMVDVNLELFQISRSLLFPYNDMFIKYRITYSDFSSECAETEIENIMTTLQWVKK